MMSLARPFEIQNGTNFFLSHSKDVNYPKKGVMVRPCISVVASIERFALCKVGLRLFHNHYVVFDIRLILGSNNLKEV
jgi:hypothetical protein